MSVGAFFVTTKQEQAATGNRFGKFAFCSDDGFLATKLCGVSEAGAGDNAGVRLSDLCESADFSTGGSTKFDDRDIVVRFELQQCQRHSELIVEILRAAE